MPGSSLRTCNDQRSAVYIYCVADGLGARAVTIDLVTQGSGASGFKVPADLGAAHWFRRGATVCSAVRQPCRTHDRGATHNGAQ